MNEHTESTGSQQPDQAGAESDASLYVGIIDQQGRVRKLKHLDSDTASTLRAAIDQLPDVSQQQRRRHRTPPLPAITSSHKTNLPGTDQFLVLTGSFGPGITKQPSLWGDGGGFDLTTPAGSLRVEGQDGTENTTLQHYVARELGPEGLKLLTGLIDTYEFLTEGQDQRLDVEVTAKQILQRLGREEHADDKDEQLRLVNTAIYLARTFITVISSKQQRSSPLLVLESTTTAEDGTVSMRYHLGLEFFEALRKQQHYLIPTPRVIGYHSVKSQHELLLTFYLGNRLAVGQGHCSMYFVTLCTQSGLYAGERLQPGEKNRTRDAQQVIFALERMEQDGLIVREAHPDVDMVLAVQACLDQKTYTLLAPATQARLKEQLPQLRRLETKALNAKRRIALQRLLNVQASREDVKKEIPEYCTRLRFYIGPLLLEQTEAPSDENLSELDL